MYLPAGYRIKIRGRLDESWSDWFDSMTIEVERSGDRVTSTTLTIPDADHAALHGILARIRDLGMLLLLVERLD